MANVSQVFCFVRYSFKIKNYLPWQLCIKFDVPQSMGRASIDISLNLDLSHCFKDAVFHPMEVRSATGVFGLTYLEWDEAENIFKKYAVKFHLWV